MDLNDRLAETTVFEAYLAEVVKDGITGSNHGRIFFGFNTTTVIGPNLGFALASNESAAVDAEGNLILWDTVAPVSVALTQNQINYIHAYFDHTDSDYTSRRAYSSGGEVTQVIPTRKTRVVKLYKKIATYGAPSLSGFSTTETIDGALRYLIPLFAIRVDGSNNVDLIQDWRPFWTPSTNGYQNNLYNVAGGNPDLPFTFASTPSLGIKDIRSTLVAITDRLKQLKGTTHWWDDSSQTLESVSTEWTNTGGDIYHTGKVGINVTPAYDLDILSNDIHLASASGDTSFLIDRVAGSYGGLKLRTGTSLRWKLSANADAESGSNVGSNFEIWRYSDAGASLAQALVIKRDTGYVGVNCSPSFDLDIAGNGLRLAASTGNSLFYLDRTSTASTAGIQLRTGTSLRWQLDMTAEAESGANAGSNFEMRRYSDAGASLSQILSINRATGVTQLNFGQASLKFDGSASTSGYIGSFTINDTGLIIGHNSNSRTLELQTFNTTRFKIDSSIDTVSVALNSFKIGDVNTTTYAGIELGYYLGAANNRDCLIDFHGVSDSNYNFRIIRSAGTNGNADWLNTGTGDIRFYRDSTLQFSSNATYALDVSGTCHASSFPTSSDIRFKDSIKPLKGCLDKISKIRGVSFQWNELHRRLGRSNLENSLGVIAQEVKEVFPELVTKWKAQPNKPTKAAKDKTGHAVDSVFDDTEYYAVEYSRFTAILIEAVKELHEVVKKQGEKISELEDRPSL
jgi:hypothetical protein